MANSRPLVTFGPDFFIPATFSPPPQRRHPTAGIRLMDSVRAAMHIWKQPAAMLDLIMLTSAMVMHAS